MRKSGAQFIKFFMLGIVITFAINTGALFGQQENGKQMKVLIKDQSIKMSDDHKHGWDDLRLLLITVTEVNNSEIRWKHQTEIETKTGVWHVGNNLRNSDRGIKSNRIKAGSDYVAIYCSQCETVIWLYDSN
jgi:hypothetical protein